MKPHEISAQPTADNHDNTVVLPTLLTPSQVSEALGGVPEKTLANWRSQRKGPLFLRVGTHVVYRQTDVAAWLAERVEDGRRWMAS